MSILDSISKLLNLNIKCYFLEKSYILKKKFNIACQYLDIIDKYLLFEYLLFDIHFSPCGHQRWNKCWSNISSNIGYYIKPNVGIFSIIVLHPYENIEFETFLNFCSWILKCWVKKGITRKKVNTNNQHFRAAQQKPRCLILLSQGKILK